ncbi:hypothetical protein [Rhizobium sp. H4]|nr:hypothetical protein [Rhizobium sp. H4]
MIFTPRHGGSRPEAAIELSHDGSTETPTFDKDICDRDFPDFAA